MLDIYMVVLLFIYFSLLHTLHTYAHKKVVILITWDVFTDIVHIHMMSGVNFLDEKAHEIENVHTYSHAPGIGRRRNTFSASFSGPQTALPAIPKCKRTTLHALIHLGCTHALAASPGARRRRQDLVTADEAELRDCITHFVVWLDLSPSPCYH